MRPRHLTLVTLAALLAVGIAAPVQAQVTPEELAAADVVIDPAATVSAEERGRLSAAAEDLRRRGAPTKFVILAQRPVNPPQLARDLRQSIGFNGNVLVLSQSPRSLGIASGRPGSSVQEAFDSELPRLQTDPVDGTIAVATRLATAPSGASDAPRAPAGGTAGGDEGGGGSGWLLLGLLALGGFGLVALMRRAGRRQAEADEGDLADEQAALEPLVDALATQIGELDTDVRLGGDRAVQARPHYDEAVLAYGEVRDDMAAPDSPARLGTIRQTLQRGLRAAQAARAVLDGRPPPAPEETALLDGLCAFDPKHGRAVDNARVVTPAGAEATLPVCRDCADGLEHGAVPEVRRVSRHGREVPYWEGAGAFGFGGGLFPMFGGMLGGMMLHDLLTPDRIFDSADGDGGDSGDSGDFGDFGGGDFGDFGGGDFGGGDF